MKYWLCLTNLENWKIIKEKKVYAFNEQNKKYLNLIEKGDKIIMYVIPKKIGGVFEVEDTSFSEKVLFPDGEYPYTIGLKKIKTPEEFVEMNQKIASKLKLFNNALRWGTILMGRSIKEIEESDYDYLYSLIEKC